MQRPSLLRLFLFFLKIGATSFGGHVALVAVMRKDLCEKKKWLNDHDLLDFLTLGTIMPGPLAVNVVSACGFAIRGMAGAITAIVAVLLPAFVLMCVLAHFYFIYGNLPVITEIFGGLLPGVAAVIAAAAWSLAKKNITSLAQGVILALAALAGLFISFFLTPMIVIAVAAVAGYFIFRKHTYKEQYLPVSRKRSYAPAAALGILILIGIIFFLIHPQQIFLQQLRLISLSFGSTSPMLFGGGYVYIPTIEKMVVGVHHWVTPKEFSDGIALGQVTPGPISISAAFIGWKVAGIWGALVATLSIYFPPAFMMLTAQQFMDRLKGRPSVEAVFMGVRPAVIGLIAAAVWVIGKSSPAEWQSAVIFVLALGVLIWKNADVALVIIASGVLGFLLHLL